MANPLSDRSVRVTDFDRVRIHLASPDEVRGWSFGEVTKAETINYRTQRPEKDGLFDERIFGPERDFECYCGKYKRVRFKGIVCDKCGVEVTRSSVRRERMAHIELAVPVAHIWFLKGVPSRIGLMLDIPAQALERVAYFNGYLITNVDEVARVQVIEAINQEWKSKTAQTKTKAEKTKLTSLRDRALEEVKGIAPMRVLTEPEYFELSMRYAEIFVAGTGAEILRSLLVNLDLIEREKALNQEMAKAAVPARRKIGRQLKLVRAMRAAGVRPEWMIMTVLPVLPPDLRPMVQLDGGRFATSDLNDLYRRVINRNNRLKHLQGIGAPEVIQRNEKRMLQEAVDALIDNSMRKGPMGPATGASRRPLRSLADMLRGKQGRFRANLLGKRVDYSGRSVIVVGPQLDLHECGLPKTMAMELFKPFVIQKLLEREHAYNIRGAIHLIEDGDDVAWAILEEVIEDKYVLLNRAPTLHRLSVQAFKPILIEGSAIQLHPLVCPAFNADFDGDQMAVHVPISRAAQREAGEIMLASKNLLKPASGFPIAVPRHDMVLGIYVMTQMAEPEDTDALPCFADMQEAKLAHGLGRVTLTEPIRVRINKPVANDAKAFLQAEVSEALVVTSIGRIVVNDVLSDAFPFINAQMKDKDLNRLTGELIRRAGVDAAAVAIDQIKNLGFEYATRTGVTWSMDDIAVPKEKPAIVEAARKKAEQFRDAYEDGLLSADERRRHISNIWKEATSEVAAAVPKAVGKDSPVYAIIESGARGSWGQLRQVAGMKGPVVNPSGETMEVPIISSFMEGFNVLEYFISTHGARKGSTDTALRTATAGYLTRRLVDVSQEVVIGEEDCKTKDGITVHRADSKRTGQEFFARLLGRIAAEDIMDGRKTLIRKGEVIEEAAARDIDARELEEVVVRSPLTCKAKNGMCQTCYGWDLGRNQTVQMGEAVGIVAAQAIGEPGTQLTMRTFHTGGVATDSDITHGLLRVEEIFEARPPKGQAVLADVEGKIKAIRSEGLDRTIVIKVPGSKSEPEEVTVPHEAELLVREGDSVAKGDQLTKGSIDLKELFRLAGQRATERYIMREVQSIYAVSGAVINDKHIEIMIRQMLSRVRIKEGGGTVLAAGEIIPRAVFDRLREAAKAEKKELPEASTVLLGITTAALASDSFLAAASFQETSRVLIRAALEGAIDPLARLKENIVIGRLIPAGTGYRREYAADAYVGTIPETPEFSLEEDPALAEFALVASESEGGDFPAEAPLDSEEKAEQVKEAVEDNQ